jgi:hypothetical protein
MTVAWVLPIGHYLGPFHPGPDEPMECHRVRVGAEVVKLVTDTEFLVWALAHGVPGVVPSDSDLVWTRAAVTGIASERGADDLTDTFDALLATGVLVEVGPDAVDPATFARGHRLQPLLAGLGTGPGRPDRHQIGVFGEEPAAVVDIQVFDLWQWAPRVGTVWDLGEVQSSTASLLGDQDDGVPGLLRRVHRLLAHGCGYLDVAATST